MALDYIDTGYKTIFRVDNALDIEVCDQLYNFMIANKLQSNPTDNVLPWFDDETYIPWDLDNINIKRQIVAYRKLVTQIVSEKFNQTLYPEFTHLVLWRMGRQMPRHKDNGYEPNDPLAARKVSCVTYLNDNFTGGETFVANETGVDYVSKPVKGSVVCYLSDSTNEHGVNPVLLGNRVTMPIWFCDDIAKSEDIRLVDIIKSLS
jgi:hypothetical protein